MKAAAKEVGRTVRAAIEGWPQTARLILIITVVTICAITAQVAP